MTIEVYTPRWGNFLTKMFVGRGGRGGSPLIVLDDILPVISMIDPGEFEAHWFRDERPWGACSIVPAVALQYAFLSVQNPIGSNVLAVIEGASVSGASTAGPVYGAFSAMTGAAVVTAYATDGRDVNGSVGSPVLSLSVTVGSIAAPTISAFNAAWAPLLGASEPILTGPTQGCVLKPGQGFVVMFNTVNVGGDISVNGYVRQAEPSELA
jgi:hypothetical protein